MVARDLRLLRRRRRRQLFVLDLCLGHVVVTGVKVLLLQETEKGNSKYGSVTHQKKKERAGQAAVKMHSDSGRKPGSGRKSGRSSA